jgi:hypothetical protein
VSPYNINGSFFDVSRIPRHSASLDGPTICFFGPRVDNVVLGQSKSIERFVAAKYDFMGSGLIEAALVDM